MASTAHSLSRLHLPIPSIRTPTSSNSSPSLSLSSFISQKSFLGTLSFSHIPHSKSFSLISPSPKRRYFSATISFNLPKGNPGTVTAEKAPKWSWRAIKAYSIGRWEAMKLQYENTGTESLLMGILIEATSLASKFLRAHGFTLMKVREECIKLLGRKYFSSSPEHPPLTEAAEKALNWAVEHKLNSGEDGEVTTTDVLLGIWSEKDSPGHKILAALGFDDKKAEELKTLSLNPEMQSYL